VATNRAVREGDWKLAWDKHARNWELYDLRADRTEAHDLASKHPKLVASLIKQWAAWANTTDVKLKK
jgi:arylsulfatase A-like enzyme